MCGVYSVIALAAMVVNRKHLLPTLTAPFTRTATRPRRTAGNTGQ